MTRHAIPFRRLAAPRTPGPRSLALRPISLATETSVAVRRSREFIFSARGWLVHALGNEIDDEFVDRCVERAVEMVGHHNKWQVAERRRQQR
jgi:hypothetical protein